MALKISSCFLFKLMLIVLNAVLIQSATEKNPNDLTTKVTTCYGLVIDAGSGGSRMHVFNWEPRIFKTIPPPISFPSANEAWTARMSPGISTLTTYAAVRNHLAPLVDFAVSTLTEHESEFSDIPIFFKATGGMRELPLHLREQIMTYVRTLLGDPTFSPFYFHDDLARVISGEEEAVFSWAAVNFLFGTLLPTSSGSPFLPAGTVNGSYGTVDLGGASTQIAFFVPSQDISEGLFKLQFGSQSHWNVYTKSFLQFGHQSARIRHVDGLAQAKLTSLNITVHNAHHQLQSKKISKNLTAVDDCFFSGYSESVTVNPKLPAITLVGPSQAHSDGFERCKAAARPLLVKYTNTYCDVVYNGQCSINGAYQPSVTAQVDSNPQHRRHFIGTSSYMFPWQILLLNATASLEEYEKQAKVVCSMSYADLMAYYNYHQLGVEDHILSTMTQDFCFIVTYVYILLTEGYGFPKNETFTVLDTINGNTVGWALGAMMYEINTMPWILATAPTPLSHYFSVLTIGILFGGLVIYYFLHDFRKPSTPVVALFSPSENHASTSGITPMEIAPGSGSATGNGSGASNNGQWSLPSLNPFRSGQAQYVPIPDGNA